MHPVGGCEKGMVLNDFASWLTRWVVRIVLLMVGAVFVLSVLALACVLATVWCVRALWCKLTGQPVAPWVMPMRNAASWASMAQRAGAGFGGMAGGTRATHAAAAEAPSPFSAPAGSKRGGILPQAAADVSDVQAREVHDR